MRLSRMRVPLFGSSWKLGELIDQTYISINNFLRIYPKSKLSFSSKANFLQPECLMYAVTDQNFCRVYGLWHFGSVIPPRTGGIGGSEKAVPIYSVLQSKVTIRVSLNILVISRTKKKIRVNGNYSRQNSKKTSIWWLRVIKDLKERHVQLFCIQLLICNYQICDL